MTFPSAIRLERMKLLHEEAYPDLTFEAVVRRFARRSRPDARRAWAQRLERKRARNAVEARRIPAPVRREVLAPGYCTYCGGWATQVDHVVPVAQGGTRRRSNLVPACSRCNFEKLDFTPEQWRAWRAEVGLPWPPVSREATLVQMLSSS